MTADTVRAILMKGREKMWNDFKEPREVFRWLHSTRILSEKKALQRANQRNKNAEVADTFLEADKKGQKRVRSESDSGSTNTDEKASKRAKKGGEDEDSDSSGNFYLGPKKADKE